MHMTVFAVYGFNYPLCICAVVYRGGTLPLSFIMYSCWHVFPASDSEIASAVLCMHEMELKTNFRFLVVSRCMTVITAYSGKYCIVQTFMVSWIDQPSRK